MKKGRTVYRVKGIRGNQVVRDGRGRFAKHVGDDSIKGYIANSESILKTVLFTAFTANKFVTVSGVFTENTNGFTGNITSRYQTQPEEVSDPLGIFLIILVSFYSLHPFGVGDSDMDGIFQKIVDWDPILPGGFHADVKAVVVD
jgi:hypothetical protein